MTTTNYRRLETGSPTPDKGKPVAVPIGFDKLELDADEIRRRLVNFRDFLNNKFIGDIEFRFINEFQGSERFSRCKMVKNQPLQCIDTFVCLTSAVKMETDLQSILVMLSDIVSNEELLPIITSNCKLGVITRPLMSILYRNNIFCKYQANMIIAKLAFSSKEEIPSDDLDQYMGWCVQHLNERNNEYYLSLSKALQYLMRRDCYRIPFYRADGVKRILDVLDDRADFQQRYQLIFCLWMLTFNDTVVNSIKQLPIVLILSDVLRSTEKEKVKRIIMATLRNLIEKPEKPVVDMFASQMIHFKVLRVLNVLVKQQWVDKELEEDIHYLHEQLTLSEQDLSSFDEYVHEVRSGRLEWSPVHRSEKFWRENVTRFNENDYEILRLLVSILEEAHKPLAVSVACFDLGEYVRYHPRGKKVVDRLNVKELVMKLVVHADSEIRMQALLAVQKMMVQNWEYLGKQLKGTSAST